MLQPHFSWCMVVPAKDQLGCLRAGFYRSKLIKKASDFCL